MGMHTGAIAAKTTLAQLRDAFFQTWPQFELAVSEDHFAHEKAVWEWKKSHEHLVFVREWSKSNPDRRVYVLWQDGPWAILSDSSYVLASNQEALAKLSTSLGIVISFVIETSGGCAFFWCFEHGQLRRYIGNNDTEVTMQGEPLPQEAGIDVSKYYMNETEELWKALGLTPREDIDIASESLALCVIDRTDYGPMIANMPSNPFAPRKG